MKIGFAATLGRVFVRLLVPELRRLRMACEGIQAALEYRNAQEYGTTLQPNPDEPAVEVSYVNSEYQQAIMDIELRLTQASGAPPTEDQILAEYERRFGPGPEASNPA
jgi:hypothetical protein